MNIATSVEELRVPPGNRLHKLSGDSEGQWAIIINQQYRVCFVFEDGDAYDVDPPRVYKIVAGERGITADTALRLARYFGASAQYWLNLQNHYDLEMAKHEAGDRIEREVQPLVTPTS